MPSSNYTIPFDASYSTQYNELHESKSDRIHDELNAVKQLVAEQGLQSHEGGERLNEYREDIAELQTELERDIVKLSRTTDTLVSGTADTALPSLKERSATLKGRYNEMEQWNDASIEQFEQQTEFHIIRLTSNIAILGGAVYIIYRGLQMR